VEATAAAGDMAAEATAAGDMAGGDMAAERLMAVAHRTVAARLAAEEDRRFTLAAAGGADFQAVAAVDLPCARCPSSILPAAAILEVP
jgi:hypothetical protein